MIYNNKFIWLHFPKVAGTKIEEIFKKYYSEDSSIYQDNVGILRYDNTAPWHDTIDQRKKYDENFSVGDRTVIVCIRKLSGWLKSRYNFEYKRTPGLPHNPNLLLEGKFLEATGFLNNSDQYIANYLPPSLFKHNVEFIRMENFEHDLKKIFSKFIDVSIIPDDEFFKKSNTSENFLPQEILQQLKVNDFSLTSPKWFKLEKKIYE